MVVNLRLNEKELEAVIAFLGSDALSCDALDDVILLDRIIQKAKAAKEKIERSAAQAQEGEQ